MKSRKHWSMPLILPLGIAEMGQVLGGRAGWGVGLAFGTIVGLPVILVWVIFYPVGAVVRGFRR